MSVRAGCSQCGLQFVVTENLAGRQTNCTRCGAIVYVPVQLASPGPNGEPDEEEEEKPAAHNPLAKHKHSTEAKDLVDMTAMVDIVFFMLIFFMVTSMHAMQASMEMPTPKSKEGGKKSQTVAEMEQDDEYVTVRIDQDDVIYIDDNAIHSDQELRIQLKTAVNATNAKKLLVLGSPDASNVTLVMVLDAAVDAGLQGFRLSVDESHL